MRVIKVKELSLESINALKKGRKSGTDMRYRTRCQMMLELHVNKLNVKQVSEMFSVGREVVIPI